MLSGWDHFLVYKCDDIHAHCKSISRHCKEVSCKRLAIYITNSPTVCDDRFCWAKRYKSIRTHLNGCLGKSWGAVTLEDLKCPGEKEISIDIICSTYTEEEVVLAGSLGWDSWLFNLV